MVDVPPSASGLSRRSFAARRGGSAGEAQNIPRQVPRRQVTEQGSRCGAQAGDDSASPGRSDQGGNRVPVPVLQDGCNQGLCLVLVGGQGPVGQTRRGQSGQWGDDGLVGAVGVGEGGQLAPGAGVEIGWPRLPG